MRMTASWSGSERTYRIQVCGVKMRPNGELPSDLYGDIHQSSSHAGASQKRPLAVHRPSACSGVKALRNTSDAKAASRQALLPFRSLDPFRALREPDRRRRDEKRPFPLRTKNCQHNPKQPLDRKSPIQVHCELDLRGRDRGLSLYLESQAGGATGQYLLDFGYTPEILVRNFDLLGIEPERLNGLILSHGHRDHYGGLAGFVAHYRDRMRGDLCLFAGGKETFREKWVGSRDEEPTSWGTLDRESLHAAG